MNAYDHSLGVFGPEGIVDVQHEIEDVERHPAHGEDEGDDDQQRVEPTQPTFLDGVLAPILANVKHQSVMQTQTTADLGVDDRYDQDGRGVLQQDRGQ